MVANPIQIVSRARCGQRPWWSCCFAAILLCCTVVLDARSRADESRFDWNEVEEKFRDQEVASEVMSSDAAAFGKWEDLVTDDHLVRWGDPAVKPIDWIRRVGFRHSSSDGRNIGKGIPLEGSSWMNRPYHVDWFVGTLIGDDLIDGRAKLGNELLGGVRLGWDFDYYWGVETRFGWAHPNLLLEEQSLSPESTSFFMTDVNLRYYPWGDSKVRPYYLIGAGMSRIRFTDDLDVGRRVTLFTMPFGAGVVFQQWPWLAWRLEVLDNLAFGDDGVNTMHNVSLTAGMEVRMGARPRSYWPWRSARSVW